MTARIKTQAVSYYGYDAFGRRVLVQDRDEACMRSLYDGFTFDVIKQSPTLANGMFVDSNETGLRLNRTGKATGDRYRYLDDDKNDGNRYFYLDEGTYKSVTSRYVGERTSITVNGIVAGQNAGGEVSYFTTDLLGSVRTTTDNAGFGTNTYSYDVFGSLVEGDLNGAADYGYLGKQFDAQTGLYNYGYRDYAPEVARFTTQDPIRDGENWFAYVNSDPVNFVDLWGYEAVTVTVAVGVGAAIVVTAAVISITQSEPYKEAVKEVSTQIDNKIQEIKESVKTAFSKGKKERDGEGNPIPPGNQKQSPLGKGANGGAEDIGDPGDLGGKDFKPPEDPGPGGKVILAAAAVTSIIDNTVIPSTDNNQNEDQNNSTEEAVFTKGK